MPLSWAKPGTNLISFGFHCKPVRCCCDCHHFVNGNLRLREAKDLVWAHTVCNRLALAAQREPKSQPRPLLNIASCPVLERPPASHLHSAGHVLLSTDLGLVLLLPIGEYLRALSFYKTPPSKVLPFLTFFTLFVELLSPLAHVPDSVCQGHDSHLWGTDPQSGPRESYCSHADLESPLRYTSVSTYRPSVFSSPPPHIHNHFMKRCGSGLGGGAALCLERDQDKIQGQRPHFTDEETPPFYRLGKGSYGDMGWRGLSLTNGRRGKRENHTWEEMIWRQGPASSSASHGALVGLSS